MATSGMDENLLRELAPQVLAAVLHRYNDFAFAEDAVQEALVAAMMQWPKEGTPKQPLAWLIRVASRRMLDHYRSETARRRREQAVMADLQTQNAFHPASIDEGANREEDMLRLLLMCCHSALTRTSAVALTLRAVGGLTTAEIAKAYFVPEATMAQRISRAKQRIKASGVPFGMPSADEFSERLSAVLQVLYLIFNEGYVASSGHKLQRTDLAREAIRLTRAVHRALPDDTEIAGLLCNNKS